MATFLSQEKKNLIAAIEIGVKHSWFAISFERLDDKKLLHEWSSPRHAMFEKIPSRLLLDPGKNFHSFGYDAEDEYKSLIKTTEQGKWFYFDGFVPTLAQNPGSNVLTGTYSILDTDGREFPAEVVLSQTVAYMKEEISKLHDRHIHVFDLGLDVYYVISTPDIWNGITTLIENEVIELANIDRRDIQFVTMSECVLSYANNERILTRRNPQQPELVPQSVYMVVDMGDGYLDISVCKVADTGVITEVVVADTTKVQIETIFSTFERLLQSYFGHNIITRVKNDHKDEFSEFKTEFETYFRFIDQDHRHFRVREFIVESSKSNDFNQIVHHDGITVHADKIKIDKKTMDEFFKDGLHLRCQLISKVIAKCPEIDTIICIGKYTEYTAMKKLMNDMFSDKKIIFETDCGNAIVKGAIKHARTHAKTLPSNMRMIEIKINTDRQHTPCSRQYETHGHSSADPSEPTVQENTDGNNLQETDHTWKKKFMVASIDFGTTHSGFALSFLTDYEHDKTTHIITKRWMSDDELKTTKTPTCLLLDPYKKFHSFGYEAEKKYTELAEQEQHKSWFYFRRFKMKLFDCSAGTKYTEKYNIQDAEGRNFPAEAVFAHSIWYLKQQIFVMVKERFPKVRDDDIYYVLTTPAIWSERAKQFMRKAAEQAKIPRDHLRIALEPECAAVYVTTKEKQNNIPGRNVIQSGSKCMVIDLGGGTIDITVHNVNENDTLEEVVVPDGGPWGGDTVNVKFEQFLLALVGAEVIQEMRDNNQEDFLYLQRQFEHKKCSFKDRSDEITTVHVPESLRNLHQEKNKENLTASIKCTDYATSVHIKNEKMRIAKSTMEEFFQRTIFEIFKKIDDVTRKVPGKIETVICVGGFSDCGILKQAIIDHFPNTTVLIPEEAVSAIMKGAIIYGRDESIIERRLSRYTYGLDWNEDFDEQRHPHHKKEFTDDGYVCKDIFLTIIEKNKPVSSSKPTLAIEAGIKWKHQKTIEFPFYRSEYSESPQFIDEMGCNHMGTLVVSLPDSISHIDQSVALKVYCGSTELKVEASDSAGKTYKASFNLNETQV